MVSGWTMPTERGIDLCLDIAKEVLLIVIEPDGGYLWFN